MTIRPDIAKLLHAGYSNSEIARTLHVDTRTASAARAELGLPQHKPGPRPGSRKESFPQSPLPATDWLKDAACAQAGFRTIREYWFADDSELTKVRTAVTICGHCPVKDACLTAAVAEEEGRGKPSIFGIRGGLTATERWTRKDRAARGRPAAPRPLSPCGTTAAYERHIRNGEPIDDACRTANTEYRRKKRQQEARPSGCGTRSGYRAHRARGEEACTPCQQANADADRRLRNTGTTKPLAAERSVA